MADIRAYQPSFTAGVLSPALHARIDLAKFQSGLRQGRNIFIHAHGGASNRPGFGFIHETKNSARKTRLIPFEFNTEQSYVLELGHLTMRVYRDGGIILDGGVPYEIATPWTEDMVGSINFAQEADVMYLVHGKRAVRKLARFGETDWRLTLVDFIPKIDPPSSVDAVASGASVPLYQYIVFAYLETRSSNIAQARNDITLPGGQNRLNWRSYPTASTYRVCRRAGTSGSFRVIYSGPATTLLDTGLPDGEIPNPIDYGDAFFDFALTAVPSGAGIGANTQTYVVASVSEETGEESLPSGSVTVHNDLTVDGARNTITWRAVDGAGRYIVYKSDNGSFGYIGGTNGLSFVDENITADLADGPQTARNPFIGVGNFPRCVSFIEQRLVFASSISDPQAVWMSQSASYENFGYSQPAKASDAVTFRVKARQVNEIRSILSVKGMLLLTSAAEWLVSGGSQADAISPSAIKIDNQGYRGSSRVQPISVGNTVLFAQDRGGVVRDFSYEFASDAYTGKDLTILARHFFENKNIKSWAYAQAPHSIVWVVMDDGSLLSLTYMREHEVWAWTSHDSGGDVFEDVAVIAEGNDDVPYFLVRRLVNGVRRRYVERLHSRVIPDVSDAFFVDSGLTYDGAPATTFSGLGHLEGREVVALADGNVVRGLTVTAGAVTLANAASKVHIGLPYDALIQTLNIDLGQVQGLGTIQGRMKSISEMTLRVENTRGIFIGPYDDTREGRNLVEYRQRSTEAWNEAIRMYTGDIRITPTWDWNTEGSMIVKQFDPLPMTILALMPDLTLGR